MNATSIIYLQYWFILMLIKTFRGHKVLLKAQFYFEKFIGPVIDRVKISTLLNENKLDFKTPFLKIIMQRNHASSGHGESCRSEVARDSSQHQKCSNYALTNLLFGLCRFVRVNKLFINLSSPILELQHAPLPPKCYKPKSVAQVLILPLSSP
jgi:hypothetical protein